MTQRKLWTAITAVIAVAVLIGVAFWLGTRTSDSGASTVARPTGQLPGETVPPGSAIPAPPWTSLPPTGQPAAVDIARQWLTGQYTLQATDAGPDAWLERVAPLSTPALRTALEQYRGGNGGQTWAQFQSQQCSRTVRDAFAQLNPDAPSTDTDKWLLVTGVAETRCAQPGPLPFPAQETVSATLELVQQADGSWLVNQRVEAG
ncbi:hypothetical protein [Amycolatopsis methanolica]|uniref:hypothetical protein n=1 Tax=Amycolatopsis methanolica TaxID=1814 RepID=UPI00341817F5